MKIQDVRTVAKEKGIKSARMGKADLIRAIQRSEGNFDCYGSASASYCDQAACIWRDDCMIESELSRPD
ncbi:MAG TPA: hypothetical protein VGK27_10280 [Candidatus Deferrimicrobiaceae bacterium]|jgi:hypothetical protein